MYHGRTLTSRLPVREALTAIAKYAFIASPYPLIMSMEVHCDQAQQDKLAEILKSTLGNALVDSPLFGETLEEIFRHSTQQHHVVSTTKVDSLPSPEELKYRILVKAKNLYVVKQAARAGEEVVMDSEESSSASSDSDLKKGELMVEWLDNGICCKGADGSSLPLYTSHQFFTLPCGSFGPIHPPLSRLPRCHHLHLRGPRRTISMEAQAAAMPLLEVTRRASAASAVVHPLAQRHRNANKFRILTPYSRHWKGLHRRAPLF